MKWLMPVISAVFFCLANSSPAQVPAAPLNLQPAWLFGEVQLTWDAVPEATGYNVYRYDSTNSAWVLICDGLNVPRYRDVGISVPTSYTVTAINGTGEGPGAEPVLAQQTDDGFTLCFDEYQSPVYDTIAVLQWVVSLVAGADGMVEAGLEPTNLTHCAWNTNYAGGQRLVLTNLLPGSYYYCRVTSVDSNRTGVTGWRNFWTRPAGQGLEVQNLTYYTWEDGGPVPFTIEVREPTMVGPQVPAFITSGPFHGTVVTDAPYGFYYQPATNFSGTDIITFMGSNSLGVTATGTVTFVVEPVDDPPVPISQEVTTWEDTPLTLVMEAADMENEPVTAVYFQTYPTKGSLSSYGNQVTYQPYADATGDDYFTFYVCDAGWGCSQEFGTVLIHIAPVNDPPAVTNASVVVHAGATYCGSFLAGDPDGDALTTQVIIGPTNGTVTVNGANFEYTPNPEVMYAQDYFTYQAFDGQTNSTVAEVYLYIGSSNNVPVARDQVVTMIQNRDGGIPLDVFDPDNDELVPLPLTFPAHGTLQFYGCYAVYQPETNFLGTDAFSYQIWDRTATGNVATVTLEVIPNRPPVADPQTITLPEDWSVGFDLTGSDPDGDPVSFIIVSNPSHGRLQFTNPCWLYSPDRNWSGTDSFTFMANDGKTNGNVATISFVVTPVNDPPVASNATVRMRANTTVSFALTGSDVEGSALTYEVMPMTNGVLSGTAPNLSFTPAANWIGTNNLRFRVNDGELWSAWGTVSIMVSSSPNRAPVVSNQSLSLFMNTSIAVTLSGSDPDGDGITFTNVSGPSKGLLIGTGPNRTYKPATNYYGTDTYVYKVTDAFGLSATGTVNFTILMTNRAPVGQNTTQTVAEDGLVAFGVSATDPDGDPVSYRIVTLPAHGVLSVASFQNIQYRPEPNFFGADSMTWVANDGKLDSPTYTVTITVTPVNDPPIANPMQLTTAEDTSVGITLSATDPDGDGLYFRISTAPAHGNLIFLGPTELGYTPAANYTGQDSFTYEVRDTAGNIGSAVITITVTPVNDLPVANAQSVVTAEDTPLGITLAGSDAEGDPVTFSIVSNPAHGTLSGSGADRLYTPAPNFNGTDSFTFKAYDGKGFGAPATVTIAVTPVSDPPVGQNQSFTLPEEWILNFGVIASDPDGDALTYRLVTPPVHGTLTMTNGNSLRYRGDVDYNGTDSFTWVANDGQVDSPVYTVSITLTPVNDMPAVTNQTVTTEEDTPVTITPMAGDPDGDAITFSIFTAPAHGTATIEEGGLRYTPAPNWFGTDSFQYQAHDPSGGCNTATITVVVQPVNDLPSANALTVTIAEDAPVSLTLTGVDVEQSALAFRVVAGPAHGTLSGSAPNLVYTPAADFNGTDSFTYVANDGSGDSAPATVSLTVTPVNDPPVAYAQSVSTAYNTPVNIRLTGSDVEGSPLTYRVVSGSVGTLSGSAPELTYQPALGWYGTATLTFVVNDGEVDSQPVTVTIVVAAPTAKPAAPSSLSSKAVSSSQIDLTWSDNSTNEDGFKIERSRDGKTWTEIATVGPNVRNYSSTGLSPNTSYTHRVRAFNALGYSNYSNNSSAKTLR